MTFAACFLRVEVGEGRGQRRARDAIADDVDALDVEQVADGVDRVDLAIEDIIVERGVGDAFVGRFPADHEQGDALVDAPLHEAFLGRQVEDVEAVDPRREDDQRRLQHLVGGRRVLDQLVERRFVDDLARRHREVLAELERAALGLGDLPGGDVLEHVGEAAKQILAAALDRLLEHLRVGQREVGRAHRVDEAAGREFHPLAAFGVEPFDLVDRAEQFVGEREVGLADLVEQRVLAPFGRREAAVLGLALRRGLEADHPAPGLQALRPGVGAGAHQRHRVGGRSGAAAERGREGAPRGRGRPRRAAPASGPRPRPPSASAARGPSPRSSAASLRGSGSAVSVSWVMRPT